ncbi:MAG TPA: hypothetical protein DCG53_01440, partial [Syntrophus sp. (in: bacteria)]|nr:hypothetical protein [Syntrophus sp. (in: bacteria)]
FPGAFYRKEGTGRIGDLGYAVNMQTGAKSPFIVAEIGPANADLGEISVALAKALGGINPNPRTGAGVPEGTTLYVVFPNSSRNYHWPYSTSNMADVLDNLLKSVGGIDAALACKDEF